MPYAIRHEGDKWCVHKKNPDGSMGESRGCSDSEEMAKEHLSALYANEKKEANVSATLDQIKALLLSDETEDVNASVQAVLAEFVTRKEVDEGLIEADEVIEIKDSPVVTAITVENGDATTTFMDKLKTMTETVTSAIGGLFKHNRSDSDMMIWKEADGSFRWIGRYTNKFRDDDNPSEILASEAHRTFVDKVDKGLVPLPELQIWHSKSLHIGDADWVVYDDAGFTLAGGHSLPGTEEVFETLSHAKDIAMSHGMPTDTIKRDPNDPTVIVEYETREISILPRSAAANKLTGFAVLSKSQEEENMIPSDKKERLSKEWGLSEAQISALEAMNAEDANKAASAGIESKELKDGEPVAAPVVDTPASAQVVEPTNVAPLTPEPVVPALTADQVQATFQTALENALQPLTAKLNDLEAQVKELKSIDETRIVKQAAGTPMASLAALLGQTVQSAVGNPSTKVDGRTELAKSKPAEAEAAPIHGRTPVPFINELLAKQ